MTWFSYKPMGWYQTFDGIDIATYVLYVFTGFMSNNTLLILSTSSISVLFIISPRRMSENIMVLAEFLCRSRCLCLRRRDFYCLSIVLKNIWCSLSKFGRHISYGGRSVLIKVGVNHPLTMKWRGWKPLQMTYDQKPILTWRMMPKAVNLIHMQRHRMV